MATATPSSSPPSPSPTCVIVLGMAGSGKTTLVQRLASDLYSKGRRPYLVNLDPGCLELPYPANVDLRDSVNYKEVMKQYNLGPNGAIVTSLNLFATKFDQVLDLIDRKSSEDSPEVVIFDTPGQIEVFTWSASGAIITESLASRFPTCVVYVADSERSANPVTFMSNMVYACSILYKTKLPFIVAMNKTDVVSSAYAKEWTQNFEVFQEALDGKTSYVASMAQSLSLALEEFYSHLRLVGVSALTGAGFDEFMSAISDCKEEYEKDYKVEYEKLKRERKEVGSKRKKSESSLIHSMPMEVEEKSRIYIGLSDDVEEEEARDEEAEEESKEGEAFKSYLAKQKKTKS